MGLFKKSIDEQTAVRLFFQIVLEDTSTLSADFLRAVEKVSPMNIDALPPALIQDLKEANSDFSDKLKKL